MEATNYRVTDKKKKRQSNQASLFHFMSFKLGMRKILTLNKIQKFNYYTT
jgi:hypothetical protein